MGPPAAAGPSGRGSSLQKPKGEQQEQHADGNTARSGLAGVGYLPELLIADGQEVCIEEVRLLAWEAAHLRQQAEEMVDEAGRAAGTRSAQNVEAAAGNMGIEGTADGEKGKEVAARPRSLLSLFSDVASSEASVQEPAALPSVHSDASRESGRKERDGHDHPHRTWMRSGSNVRAEDLLLDHYGSSPPGGGEEGRHEGLVDPIINTKEALADIMSMFKEPLPFEKVPAGTKRAASGRQDHGVVGGGEAAGGFQVYTDETEEEQGLGRSQEKGARSERGSEHGLQASLPKRQRQSVAGDVGMIVFQDDEFAAAPSVQKEKQMREEEGEEEEFDGDAENRPPRGAKNLATPLLPPRSLKSPEVSTYSSSELQIA